MAPRRSGYVAIALLPLLGMAVLSCAGSGDPALDPDGLTGSTWVLDAASTDALVDEPPADGRVDIRFDGEEVSGTSGCNRYGGPYEAGSDGSISLGPLAMTEMACDDLRMTLESAYVEALGAVTSFRMSEGALALRGGEIDLTFTEEVPIEPLPLEATAWTLDTIATGTDAVSSVLAGTEVTLALEGGTAGGSGGCNRFSGGYELDGASLAFGPLASTRMACAEGVMSQEQAVFDALAATASWSVEEDRLWLLDADGSLLLGYRGPAGEAFGARRAGDGGSG